jgi:predicted permease
MTFEPPWRRVRVRPETQTVRDDVGDEIAFHLTSREQDLARAGIPANVAREQALREFGDVKAARDELMGLQAKLAHRRARAAWWFDLVTDVRFALRALARQPGYAAALLLTLALGIGATASIFTVVHAALLKPLPFRDAGRVVHVWETNAASRGGITEASFPNYLDWRAPGSGFVGLEGYDPTNAAVGGPGGTAMLRGARVTAGFFDLLDVVAAVGRTLRPGEDGPGGTDVVILSHGFWQRQFGGDPGVVGTSLTINGRAHEIVGVLPRGFHYAPAGDAEFWLPLDRAESTRQQRFNHWLRVVGRLEEGVGVREAETRLGVLANRLAAAYPETNRGRGVSLVPVREQMVGNIRPLVLALSAAVVLLLMIACANVGSLLLARSVARRQEWAVRAALGASRSRLMRQLAAENLVIAVAGGALGFAAAQVGVRGLLAGLPDGVMDGMAYLRGLTPDGAVVAFIAALSLLVALSLGAAPAWSAGRLAGSAALASRSRTVTGGIRRVRDLLVAGELAFTAALLVGVGLVGRSLARLLSESPGFHTEQILTARVSLAGAAYQDAGSQQRFFQALLGRVSALPGVRDAGAVSNLPLSGGGTLTYRVEGLPEPDPAARPEVIQRGVAGDYFPALGIPVIAGRVFGPREDSTSARVIVINESLARRHFPTGGALGRRFRFYAFPDAGWEIIGVVGDVKTARFDEAPPPTVYYSHLQAAENRLTLALRTAGDPVALGDALRDAVRALDPEVPVYGVSTMKDVVANSPAVFLRRYPLFLMAAFGGAALVLALVGVYGVITYSVALRRREIGIRAALGATPGSILRRILGQGVALAAAGLVTGFALALVFGRFLAALLYDVRVSDPVTFMAVALVLGATALAASAIPARRAAALDPGAVLRVE